MTNAVPTPASRFTTPRLKRAQLDVELAADTARRVVSRRHEKLGHDPLPALMARSAFSEATRVLRETAESCR